ncbi:hypothetical protein QP158_12275, partial [Streptococcus agalactiae]|nr:hypothetical protein [Streptococcus agalactiae]
QDQAGNDVFLRDIWPDPKLVQETIDATIDREMFLHDYADVFKGYEKWRALETPDGATFDWAEDSTYIRKAPFFEGMTM